MTEYLPISKALRSVGSGDVKCFPLAYGCWRAGEMNVEELEANLNVALDAGITMFDSADIYGWDGENLGNVDTQIGAVFARNPGMRDKMLLATKGGIHPNVGAPYIQSEEYLIKACETSLMQLQTDYVDLYYIHRPDLLAHPEEVAGALTKLKDTGKIKHVAVSNFTAAQVSALQHYLDVPIAAHQVEMSPYYQDLMRDGTLDQMMQLAIAPVAWSPLAGGRLIAGNMDGLLPDETAKLARVISKLDQIAHRNDTDRASVCLAFLLAHPAAIIPIIGTNNPQRIKDALKVFDVKLTRADWYGLVEAAQGYGMP